MYSFTVLLVCVLLCCFVEAYPLTDFEHANPIVQSLRERRAAEQETETNNNAYLEAIRSLSLRDGTPLMFGKTSLHPMGGEQRSKLFYPSSTYWSIIKEGNNAPGIKNFSSSNVLCRKLRMC